MKYKLVVMSFPVEGREREYNEWYDNVHLKQLLQIPGIVSARRYRAVLPVGTNESYPYAAIYDIEADDVSSVIREMTERAGTDRLVVSEALSQDDLYGVVYEELDPTAGPSSGI